MKTDRDKFNIGKVDNWNFKNKKSGFRIINIDFWKAFIFTILIMIILEHGIIGYLIYDGKLNGLIENNIDNIFYNNNNLTVLNDYEFSPSTNNDFKNNFETKNNFTINNNIFVGGNCT